MNENFERYRLREFMAMTQPQPESSSSNSSPNVQGMMMMASANPPTAASGGSPRDPQPMHVNPTVTDGASHDSKRWKSGF